VTFTIGSADAQFGTVAAKLPIPQIVAAQVLTLPPPLHIQDNPKHWNIGRISLQSLDNAQLSAPSLPSAPSALGADPMAGDSYPPSSSPQVDPNNPCTQRLTTLPLATNSNYSSGYPTSNPTTDKTDGLGIPEPCLPGDDGSGGGIGNDVLSGSPGGYGDPYGGGGYGGGYGNDQRVTVQEMMQLGLMFYSLVELNQPRVKANTARLSILPIDPKKWELMSGWTGPHSSKYRVVMKNLLGVTVVNYEFQVVFYANGAFENRGRFLANLQVIPQRVEVAWGYRMDSNFQVADIINMGTKANPIAGAHFEIQYRVHSLLKRIQGVRSFFVRGTSEIGEIL
jgi:hypothetical protein